MDYTTPSSGVELFWDWMSRNAEGFPALKGIEMGCGKGRNCIWLAEQGATMTGFDFSEVAIAEAKKRDMERSVTWTLHDAMKRWPWPDSTFDFAIDCFASTDIESPEGRTFARDEFKRVLKSGGILFVYAISNRSPFHQSLLLSSPAPERNTYTHPSGKVDKVFDEEELRDFYHDWMIGEFKEIKKPKGGVFYEKEYDCENFWILLQK